MDWKKEMQKLQDAQVELLGKIEDFDKGKGYLLVECFGNYYDRENILGATGSVKEAIKYVKDYLEFLQRGGKYKIYDYDNLEITLRDLDLKKGLSYSYSLGDNDVSLLKIACMDFGYGERLFYEWNPIFMESKEPKGWQIF